MRFIEKKRKIDQLCVNLSGMPSSNGSKYFEQSKLRIAIISDEFFFNSIKDSANFIYLTKSNWSEVFGEGIDVFFFETAWHGIGDEWNQFAWPGANNCKDILDKILLVCRNKEIPSIFFSKEDPPDFYTFLELAKKFDVVFTSAVECIEYYKKALNHNRVYASSFCINPVYNNPIGMHRTKQSEEVLFAGAWYKAFPERCADQRIMFDGVLKSHTTSAFFIDRFFTEKNDSEFPREYHKYVYPGVSHSELQKLHKRIRWAINLNSIRDSYSMFANRTFELLANGNLIISNYSLGVNELLPTIFTINSSEEVVNILDKTSEKDKYNIQMAGIRTVLDKHTCFHRINEYLKPVNLDRPISVHEVLVVIEDEINKKDFSRQTYARKSFCYKEELTNEKLSKYKMIAWFGKNYRYEPFYLEDMINVFKYTTCSFVTKHSFVDKYLNIIQEGIEHDYTNEFNGKFCSVCWISDYDRNLLLDINNNSSKKIKHQQLGYASDRLNIYKRECRELNGERNDYKISLVIPLHNNANRFVLKGFESIKRSSLFEEIEILLINDASDFYNTGILENIAEKFNNVKLINLPSPASGSASRPRNVGMSLSQAPYIAFMDPDDELINDGLHILYEKIIETKTKVCFGNSWLLKREPYLWNPYRVYYKLARADVLEKGFKDYIAKAEFMTPGISGILFDKDLCAKLEDKPFVDGAFAEDTFFMWKLMCLEVPMSMVNLPVYNYFAGMAGTVTNICGSSFFYRSALVIEPMKKWLEDNNLLDSYVNVRLEGYIEGWLFNKLKHVDPEDCECACNYVMDVIKVFYGNYKIKSKTVNTFIEFCQAKDYKGAVSILPEDLYKIKNFGIRNRPVSVEALEGGENSKRTDESLIYQFASLSINKSKIQIKYVVYKILSKMPLVKDNEKILLRYEKYKRLRKMIKSLKDNIIFM